MATSSICGYGGSVTGCGSTEVKEWNINLVQDAPEATAFSSNGWKEFVPCLQGGSGSFKSNDPSEIGPTTATFLAGATGLTIAGDIIINKCTDTTPVDGIVTFSTDFVFTGSISAGALI